MAAFVAETAASVDRQSERELGAEKCVHSHSRAELLKQDLSRDFGGAAAAADQLDRFVQIGPALRDPLGEGKRVAGLDQDVQAPALDLAALVPFLFLEEGQLIHVPSVLPGGDDSCRNHGG